MNKYSNSDPSIVTRNFDDLVKETNNLYETIAILGKRARQISSNVKKELDEKLNSFAVVTDNLEEVFENKEQIEISRFYERMPKPPIVATEEFLNGELATRKKEELELGEKHELEDL